MPGVIETGGDGDSIKVFVRVRPPCDDDRIELGSCLTVNSQRNAIIMNSKPEPKVFTYDHIADIYTTQETVFSTIGKPLIESCVAGYNGTIFAYGQTGSGKTFTMIGPSEDCDNFQHAQRGVIPHSFEQLFALIKKEQLIHGVEMVEFLCRCSFLEIYNEQVYDLLDPTSTGLQLRENIKRGVFVDGLIERSVTSACDAYQVLAAGWANRTVAATSMNRESSRSHAVFTLHIESKKKMEDGVWHVRSSQLNLVDLAGSERQKDTHTIGVRLKEAGSINKSLSALGNVIMALGGIAHGKSRHVPYRDSKLSFLLRDSLGGNAKTHMIACVHPGARCFGETLSTLQFASRAKTIKNKAVVNEDAHGSVPSLQAEIRRLKLALLQVNSGVGQKDTSGIKSSDLAVSVPATKWKDCFLQAMLLREQLQEGVTVSRENYIRLEQACSRKDQALRQSRMVLKFREDALRKLEKAHKEKVDVTTDDKDAIIVALRNEVQTLQQLVDQHPDVTAYKLMTESLKADVELAHKQMRHTTEMTEKKAHELEAVYRQLQAQHNVLDAPTRRSSVSTPQTSQESALSTATLERLKSQNSKQQAELESLRKELATERNNSQRALIEHEAQLVSLRRGRDELEKVLKSHQVHMQMERQARQDMHLKTLKTMTTPKKAKYNLRNRTVLVEASGNGQPHTPEIPRLNLDMSFDGTTTNDDDIMAETAPPEWIGETLDALTDEIQQLQEENRYLRVQLESKEADTVLMVEKFSQLDSQKLQTQQLYESAKDVWNATEEELQQTINRLTKELKDANFSAEVAQDEVKDLWVMVGGLDKQVKETQQTEKTLKDTNNTHTAALKTKILQLEMEVATLQKESSELSEELTSVKEHEETLQTTLDFNLEQQTELEQQLKAQFTAVEQLQTQLKLTVSSQQQAETKNQQLVSQLQQEAGKEEQLLVALQQVETLQAEVESMRATITSLEGEVKELQGQFDQKSAQIDHLKKTNQEKQEALQAVSATLTEQKQRLQVAECQLEGVTRQLDETVEHSEALQATCRTMEEAVDQLREDLDTQQAKFEETLQKKDVEVELLNEDLQDQLDCNNKALNELQMANQMNEQLTAQLDKIKQLSAVSAEKSEESASKELDLKERLEILKSAHQVQLEEFNSVKEELMAKNQQLEKQLLVVEKANADLVSHQNLKQKIHYHAQLKEANIQLTEKLRKATDEVTKYKQLYLKNTGKENVPC